MDIQTKSKKIALLFFQPKKKLLIFCENITKLAQSSLGGGGGGGGGGGLSENKVKKLITLLHFFNPLSRPFHTPTPHPLSPLIRCNKDPIIVFLRCLQNYGVSGGGRLNERGGGAVKYLVVLNLCWFNICFDPNYPIIIWILLWFNYSQFSIFYIFKLIPVPVFNFRSDGNKILVSE